MRSPAGSGTKRSSSSVIAASSQSSVANCSSTPAAEVEDLTAPDPKRRTVWTIIPNPNSSAADAEKNMPVFKCDMVKLFLIQIIDPMGQPKAVVNEINGPNGFSSKDPTVRLMANNVAAEYYRLLGIILQGETDTITA